MDNGHPLLRVVFIDTNQLKPGDLQEQIRFIEEAFSPLAKPATWRIVAAHHPIRNFGKHGETPGLVSALLPVLKKYHVDLYMAGHDHDQQLIAHDGEPYYVISGGGGKDLYPVQQGNKSLLFGESEEGFVKAVVTSSNIVLTYYDGDAEMEVQYAAARNCTGLASACLKQTLAPINDNG